MSKQNILPFVLIICLGFGIYVNSLKNEFVWDDKYLVVKDPYIRSFKYFFEFFKIPLGYHLTNEKEHKFRNLGFYIFIASFYVISRLTVLKFTTFTTMINPRTV